ncbi:cytidine deaminase-like protein [Choiromyces venosus 120613-1]|uniref:Cytidine deaminase-like protein n=1 Tax=Choiromyces venosus 120613-1 TaxID=1336337 RepID=A0A3N4JZ77_9PEZI|nr:cytidine deaminase-like protein [Choiromyces venosus 120613-1]
MTNLPSPTMESEQFFDEEEEVPLEKDSPLHNLILLRTLQEIKAAVETIDVFTVPIPSRSANVVLSSLRAIVPTSLQHLRRLVKPCYIPDSLVDFLAVPTTPPEENILYLLVCPVTDISEENLRNFLQELPAFSTTGVVPRIMTVAVPSSQPISAVQATEWSAKYWPAVYKRGNPYGPHPSIVSQSLRALVDPEKHLRLAKQVATQAASSGEGLGFGAVIVDPQTGQILAAAGDARLRCKEKGWGNPLDHAAMRAIDMVAQRRLGRTQNVRPDNKVEVWDGKYLEDEEAPAKADTKADENSNTENEDKDGDADDRKDDGYLCHNLQVYLSHEPCVMCSMALLHSRVGAVAFGTRMTRTGALNAEEGGRQMGLFWRPELNWKFVCWQWKAEPGEEMKSHENVDA